MTTKTIDRNALISELGLTVESVFVPFSQSRNKGEKLPTLNWRITVKKDGRDVLTTDYSAGSAHCPAYKASTREMGSARSLMRDGAIRFECEHGFAAKASDNANSPAGYTVRALNPHGKQLEPDTVDVLYSLAMDSDVLDAGGFESWAADLGYDTDSRKAEGIYQACLDIALKLRSALGDDGLRRLRDSFQDY